MREYVFSSILLLTLCTVSPFKIYLPGETTNDGGENKVHLISDQVTALCVGLCLDRKLPDDDVAAADCRSWCQEPLGAAALVAATVDVGDLAPGRHRPSTSAPVYLRLNNPHDDGDKKGGRGGAGRVSGMGSTSSHRATTAVGVMAAKRQVDPLLSCIEARCAGLGRSRYPACVYSKCLAGWKRKRDNHPGRRSTGSNPPEEQEEGRQEEEEEQPQGGRRREEWDNTLSGHVHDAVRESWNGDVKRSWNDVMQTCIEYKCRHTAPGTFDYNVCIQQACSKHMFGKR